MSEPLELLDALREVLLAPGFPNEHFNELRFRGRNQSPPGYPEGSCGRCGARPGGFHFGQLCSALERWEAARSLLLEGQDS